MTSPMQRIPAAPLALLLTLGLTASCSNSNGSPAPSADGGSRDAPARRDASGSGSGSTRHDGGADARSESGSGSGSGTGARTDAGGDSSSPPPACAAATPCIYVAESSAGKGSGADCANAYGVSWFNDSSSWGSSVGQIGPGTSVHLCGVIDVPAGTTGLTVQGSGTKAAPITIYFELGAVLESPYFPTNSFNQAALVMMNQSWVIVDGGTNGLIQNTLNGTPGAACPGGPCTEQQSSLAILAPGSSNCEIKNLTVANFYVHVGCSASTGCDTSGAVGDGLNITGSNWRVDHNTFHDIHWALLHTYGAGDTNDSIDHNDFYNMDHGIIVSSETAGMATNDYIHDNHIHDMANWDTGAADAYHHDGIHAWNSAEDEGAAAWGSFTGLYIYNNRFDGTQGGNCTAWIFLEGGYDSTGRTPWTSLFGSPNAFIYGNYFTNSDVGANVQLSVAGPAVVFNNTLIGPSTNGTDDVGDALQVGGAGPGGAPSSGLVVRNNVWTGEDTLIGGVATDTYALLPDHEFYGDYQSSYNPFWGFGVDTGTFAAWQTACQCDANSMAASGSLTVVGSNGMPASGSWLLGHGQNMYDAGFDLPGMGTDLNGVARPAAGNGNWNVGAF
jgi:hypothetical protein